MTNIQFHIPPLCLEDNVNKIRLNFTAYYTVFYPDKNASFYWKKYDILKGNILNLKLTVLWENNYLKQDIIHDLSQLISSAELWKQLHLYSTILQPNHEENIITLSLSPSQSYPVLHYPKNILYGELSEIQIKLDFKNICEKNGPKWIPKLEMLIPLIDLAFRSLLKDKLSQNIPLIAERTSQYLNNISRSLDRISRRSTRASLQGKNLSLKKVSLHDPSCLTQELWDTVKKTILIKKVITEFKPIY
ncbi:hypothetical protein PORY_000408 [Pneumocystis oryctolagi]|uniref:Uncharacterized protein n=1 Tax=Pneumocystis oryctolagi TaxID=42067 RepID=A0ACB7CG65_9ASCO|nr:hypothetical protein PORY_000408 [Pneumocystis oryctolagi]